MKEPLMSRATILGAAALVALLLAGCTTSEPAPTEPGTTAEATSSPSPSPVESSPAPVVIAPERPAEMDDDGYQGAEAAAKYFQLLDPYIMKTGDTDEWEDMSHKECNTCIQRLEQARTIAENGDVFEGGEIQVTILHTYEQDESTGGWPLDVEISTAEATIITSDGTVAAEFDEDQGLVRMEVSYVEGGWKVLGIAPLDEESSR
ncbi:DUF6318 family protein [Isoptericola sp. G70]|uniref:DUF6318 family protein n=1 Tax=Isoptericola sp. G70 TaxID=3376633 RepID=UPI003A8077E1